MLTLIITALITNIYLSDYGQQLEQFFIQQQNALPLDKKNITSRAPAYSPCHK